MYNISTGYTMVDLGFRVNEGSNELLKRRRCNKKFGEQHLLGCNVTLRSPEIGCDCWRHFGAHKAKPCLHIMWPCGHV